MKTLALAILALEANPSIYASDGTLNYMPIFKVIIAVYLLYVAVLGRGKILENKHLKIEEKKFRTIMRIVALAGGVFTLANSAMEFFLYDDATFDTLGTVLWVLGLASLAGMLVLSIVFTDKKAVAEEQRKQDEEMLRKERDKMRAAFEFDDEDEPNKADGDEPDKNESCDDKGEPDEEKPDGDGDKANG